MRHLTDVLALPLHRLAAARGALFPFAPVLTGCGIGLWFALPFEPGSAVYGAILTVALLAALAALRGPDLGRPIAVAILCVALGPLAAGLRVQSVAAPVLETRFYGPVQGRIVAIDRSQTDALRLTLDRVVLSGVEPEETPARIRLSLRAAREVLDPTPGQVVLATAHLDAPQGAVEPGSFDFRRMAFFDGLGAVGYTTVPVVLWAEVEAGEQIIPRIRTHLSSAIRQAIPGDAGAFAAGVMTGDRSGLSLDAVGDLRDSSLAHLLAISGMNLAFLVGFVFALFRGGIALVPPVALRVDAKKIAALISLPIAFFYLLLSGANVATERAFVMVAVMLGAVLLDRAAITLRSVAVAGMIILLWQPEALLEPGFQMSFAATVALIAGFEALTRLVDRRALPRGLPMLMMLLFSSLIGGIATAPYAAAHFNRFTDYGLLANLLTVSVMGAVVMPAGAVAALLAPFGLAAPALWVLEQGSRWILFVADWIAGLDGAVSGIPAPPAVVLPVLTLGALWLILWPFGARWLGVLPVLGALVVWTQHDRPAVLVDAGARLVGVIGPEGRALTRPRGAGFAASSWLENDGDLVAQEVAAGRVGFTATEQGLRFDLGGRGGIVAADGAGIDRLCRDNALVITAADAMQDGPCTLLDPTHLRRSGTVAVYADKDSLRIVDTETKRRVWSAPLRDQ